MNLEEFRAKIKELSEELEKKGLFIHRVVFCRDDDGGLYCIRCDYEDREGTGQQEEEYYE